MDKTILVCDDDPGILEMLELLLTDAGYGVIAEHNSEHALERMRSAAPHLILLDIWMPVMSGDRVLSEMRADPAFDHIPVLMYSASTEGQKIADRAGADDYIAKPFDVDVLLGTIRNLLNRGRSTAR